MADSSYHPASQQDGDEPEGPHETHLKQHPSDSGSDQTDSSIARGQMVPVKDTSRASERPDRATSLSWLAICKMWTTELLACLVALLAFTAIVMTLAIHDGQTLPDWPFDISVNALVSIFAVILKGAMMIPVAQGMSSPDIQST